MSKAKKIAVFSVLLAFSILAFIVENLMPVIIPFAPYVRIGLSNIFVLYVLVVFGNRETIAFVLLKTLLGCLLLGNFYAFPFNIAGGVFGAIAMIFVYSTIFPKAGLLSVSVCGAVVSNFARTIVGILIMETGGLILQLPFAAAIGVIGGLICGAAAYLLIKIAPEKFVKL